MNQTVARKFEAVTMQTHDPECRCCGKGNQFVCRVCSDYLHHGFMFLLEVKDNSSEIRRYFTGYVVRIKANRIFQNGKPGVPMEPGLYVVRQTELKNFLKDQYDYKRLTQQSNRPQRSAAVQPRSVTSLRHK